MVVDATATPAMAQDLIRAIRGVTDKPIRHVALTHYHAVRVLGASAFAAEGAATVIASRGTHELIVERGQADMDSEIGRFPRLFRSSESIPGLTWPTLVFERELTIRLGTLEVRMMHLGNGHTRRQRGLDSVAGHLFRGRPGGVQRRRLHRRRLPGRLARHAGSSRSAAPRADGAGPRPGADHAAGLPRGHRLRAAGCRRCGCAREGVAGGKSLKQVYADTRRVMDPEFGHVVIYEHAIPFDVSRAYDEASGIADPRVWTAERDRDMWAELNS